MADVRKINLRLPDEVLAIAADQAARMGVSANAYIVMAIRNFIPYQERILAKQALPEPAKEVFSKVGRNDPCPCGSGRKWKVCHGMSM